MMRRRGWIWTALTMILAAACTVTTDADRYSNLDGDNIDKSLIDVLRWQLSRTTPPLPDPPLPATTPQLDAAAPHATWIGHSTVLLKLSNLTLLTDPHFGNRASPVSFAGPPRIYPPGVSLAELPHVDVVLLSHNHYDHLDVGSVKALATQAGGPPLYVVPLGLAVWFADIGITNVIELGWWQKHLVNGVRIVFTPAKHWSSRTPWDRRKTLWGGFALFGDDLSIVYTGDTGYAGDFMEIRRRLADDTGFDLAFIPIGCYEPRDFMRSQHVNPAEAVQIHRDLGARRSIGVHWGTFADLCDEPLDQPLRDLDAARVAAGLNDNDFLALRRGETVRITGAAEQSISSGSDPATTAPR